MANLLLGTYALNRFLGSDKVLHDWLREQETPLHATAVSVGLLLAAVETSTHGDKRRLWTEKLTIDVPRQFATRLRPFDFDAAKTWSAVRIDLEAWAKRQNDADFPEGELYVAAIALAEGFDYVAAVEPWHAAISRLSVVDPWANSNSPT